MSKLDMEVSKELMYYGLWWTIYAYIGVVNVFAMIATANDKVKAVYDQWRIAEVELFFLVVIGGGPGTLIAMILCWHKVKKASFLCCYIVCLVPSAVGYGFLIACQAGNFGGEFCEVKLLQT